MARPDMEIMRRTTYTPAPVAGGYTDRILWVDLSANEISVQQLAPDFKEKYIGGRGYAIKLIWDGTTGDTRYDSDENILVMAGGPLCNEPAFPGTGKFIVGTISPLTDTFIDSNVGGHFSPLLKLAGFDALAVTGVAPQDVILLVDGDSGTLTIVPAPTYDDETDKGALSYGERLLRDANDGELSTTVAAVTAGEAACHSRLGIVNSLYYDKRRGRVRSKQAGRGGTGTVMRTKGLRAIVVRSSLSRGNGNNAVDPQGVRQAGSQLKKVLAAADPQQLHLSAWGTTVLSEYMDRFHLFPINNYQFGQSPDSPKLFAEVFLERFFSKSLPDGCYYGCNLACAKGAEDIQLRYGPRAGTTVGVDGPEYETVGAMSCMGIFDPRAVVEYNWYCDEYGLDSISTGVTIAFFMECYERGYLSEADAGYELPFGDLEAANRLFHEMAAGTGLGRIAGQGIARGKTWVAGKHAARNGHSTPEIMTELAKFGMEVKGLEFSMYISKESLAQQGGYGFALKGPQHDEAWLIFIDQVHKEIPSFEDKAHALRWFPLIRTWFNATGLCKLPWIDVRHPEAAQTPAPARNLPSLAHYVQYLNATTGSNKELQDILDDSERLYILQKLINVRQGKGTRASDQIPLRAMGPAFFNEYLDRAEYYDGWLRENLDGDIFPDTPEERHRMIVEKRQLAYRQLCDAVYEEKGFTQAGVPKPETVERFGLMDEQAQQLLADFSLKAEAL
ncbi:aldehyde ferredoxin oxidoreductase C-terminal domain-containing protein [Candidatus Latescibacterota bacterium]